MRSPSHPVGRGSDGLPSGLNSLNKRGVNVDAVSGAPSRVFRDALVGHVGVTLGGHDG